MQVVLAKAALSPPASLFSPAASPSQETSFDGLFRFAYYACPLAGGDGGSVPGDVAVGGGLLCPENEADARFRGALKSSGSVATTQGTVMLQETRSRAS